MNGMDCEPSSSAAHQSSFPVGTRVLILDPDDRCRATLRQPADSLPDFAIVVECQTWSDCKSVLEEMLPELLIARADLISPDWLLALDPNSTFPLVIVVGDAGGETGLASRIIDRVSLPLQLASIAESLTRARHEIFRRKAEELSYLLQHYAEHLTGSSHGHTLSVEPEEKPTNLDQANIRYLRADRNYVRVHTTSGSYEIRETMRRLISRLDLSQFAQIHRSVVVNLSCIKDISWANDAPNSVVLEDGTKIYVGPNFRDELRSLTLRKSA